MEPQDFDVIVLGAGEIVFSHVAPSLDSMVDESS